MQNLLDELKKTLETDERLVIDGNLNKNKVVELALALDEDLLRLLLRSEPIKNHFFRDINGTLVFDKIEFQRFVSNKQFLPDSYTSFKNKIGLTANGEYLTESKEVVLAWPYKDCVLEGGQTKEDQKRSEIFWNTTLASDEIDRLLDPKVLTNFKKYDKDGEHRVDTITSKDNLIIKGNNLLALHSLKKKYAGKVKLIYIDPPYNTETDSFKYNDYFNHSTWLTFLKNRLEIAYELLEKNGVIFIHIGDSEMHYLKLCADQVFKRENFIATIPRKTRSGKTDVPWKLSQDFDWILIYTKSAPRNNALFKRSVNRRYYKTEDFPNDEWRLTDLTTQRTILERPNSNFTLIDPKNGNGYPVNPNRCWGVTKDSVQTYIKKRKIVFPGDYDFLKIKQPAMRVFKSEEKDKYGDDFDKTYVSTDFLNHAMNDLLKKTTNKKGTDEIVEIFGEKIFPYPKNELLLKHIIDYSTSEGDIVMDFFLGSGTTAAVSHKMNRQFIGCEQMDYINNVTIERLKKVIDGEQGGISKDVDWQGGGSFIYAELKKANAYFIDQIEEAKDTETLWKIWEEMQRTGFISYRLNRNSMELLNSTIKSNGKYEDGQSPLSLEEVKQLLIEILDKNQLYVNYSEIEDETYQISDEDKRLNRNFYRLSK